MASSAKNYVFVYGSLKTGQPQDYQMTEPGHGTGTLVGKAVTVSRWPLVIASRFNIPFLLRHEGYGQVIQPSYKLEL